jgi:tRNA pseudouridine38-40 synthase
MQRGPRTQLLLRLGYEGSAFFGVSPQPGRPTVALALQQRIEASFGMPPRALVVASRTDAGVHAVENLATCWFPVELDPREVQARAAALRGERGDGLLDVEAAVVSSSVFARGLGSGKIYRYRLEGGHDPALIARLRELELQRPRPSLPPALGRIWQVAPELDPLPMRQAAALLCGEHDFEAFTIKARGLADTRRRLDRIEIHALRRDGRPHLLIEVQAPGFLRKMVRILVGTLAEVGAGLRDPGQMPALLASRDRQQTGIFALARGLSLQEILCEHKPFAGRWREPEGLPDP